MAFVKRAYSVVSLDTLVDALERGGPLPRRALAVTFDDGYADNHRLGLPVLRALGLPATVYVATGAVADAAPFWVGGSACAGAGGRGNDAHDAGWQPIALTGDRTDAPSRS